MGIEQTFSVIALGDLMKEAQRRHDDGCRYVQTLAVNTEAGIDLVFTFMKDGVLENLKVQGVTKEDTVPSITGLFLAAFVFENEIHDLFGVHIADIAIDFHGTFYDVSAPEPMTIISPAQKAAREKAAKLAAAKAAKEAKAAAEAGAAQTAGEDAELEAKLAAMPPEKAAKVRAAMEAKRRKAAAEAAPAQTAGEDAELEAKLAAMPPEKAAKVRAAMEAKRRKAAAEAAPAQTAGEEGGAR